MKAFSWAYILSAIVAAGAGYEVVQSPRFNPNLLEIQIKPRGNAANLLIAWQDEANHIQTRRLPVEHATSTQRWEIEIRPLDQKNDRSLGNEVWLLRAAAPDSIAWDQLPPTPGWKLDFQNLGTAREGLVALGSLAQPLRFEVLGGTLRLRFRRDERGGMAQVTVNGATRTIDLHGSDGSSSDLIWQPVLPSNAVGPTRWLKTKIIGYPEGAEGIRIDAEPPGSVAIESATFNGVPIREVSPQTYRLPSLLHWTQFAAAVTSILAFLLVCGSLTMLAIAWRDQDKTRPSVLRGLAVLAPVTISAFWTAAFYPATMSPDSMNQWGQAVTAQFTNWHPLGMTLVMRGVHVLLSWSPVRVQIATIAWIQGTLFWGAIFILFRIAKLSVRRRLVLCSLMALYYPVWLYTVTLWKDVWLGIAFFSLLWYGRRFFIEGLWTWRVWGGLTALLVFAMLERHTAWVSFVVLAALSSLFYLEGLALRKAVVVGLLSVAALAGAVATEALLYKMLRVRDIGSILNWCFMYEIAGTAHFSPWRTSDWKQLSTYKAIGEHGFEQIARDYTCGRVMDYLVIEPGHALDLDRVLHQRYAIQDLPRVVLHHPGAYLKHRVCSVAHLLALTGSVIYYPSHDDIEENNFGIDQASLLPHVRQLLVRFKYAAARSPILQIPCRHFLLLLASAAASIAMLSGKRRRPNARAVAYLFVAGFSILAPLLLITPAPDWRYLMPANLCWAASLLIAAESYQSGGRQQHTPDARCRKATRSL